MSGELQAFLGKFEVDTSVQSFTFQITSGPPTGPQSVTLDTGLYYMAAYTGETTNGLVDEVQEKIRDHGGNVASVTVDLDLTTGLVTIAGFLSNATITWDDPLLGSYLGFNGNLSGATSYVAPNPARFLWRPSLSPSKLPVDLETFWEPRSNTMMHLAPDGTPTTTPGRLQNQAAIAYDLLELAEILVDGNGLPTNNGTFEQYYRDVFHAGMQSRIVLDRTSYAAADDYKVGLFGHADGQGELGTLRNWIAPVHGEASHDLWNVDLFFAEYTGEGA